MKILKNLQILITRPEPLAQPLANALTAAGAQTNIFSTLNIKSLSENIAHVNLALFDIIIFISPNAVLNSVAVSPEHWQKLSSAIISMGSGTTQTLAKYQVAVTAEPGAGATSESLVHLNVLQNVADKKILIVAGQGGRDVIMKTLQQRGAQCQKVAVYQRVKPKQTMPLWPQPFDVIIVTSGESLTHLQQTIDETEQQNLFTTPLLVISQRMVNLVKQSAFTGPVLVSQGASNEAIITCLTEWMQQHDRARKQPNT
jgi:uroporphyrinogen-III synthase